MFWKLPWSISRNSIRRNGLIMLCFSLFNWMSIKILLLHWKLQSQVRHMVWILWNYLQFLEFLKKNINILITSVPFSWMGGFITILWIPFKILKYTHTRIMVYVHFFSKLSLRLLDLLSWLNVPSQNCTCMINFLLLYKPLYLGQVLCSINV